MKVKPAPNPTVSPNHDDQGVSLKRRQFLWQTGALALGAGLGSRLTALAEAAKPGQPNATKLGWKISVQHYTYRRFSLFEALEKAAAVGLRYFEVRSNLKLDAKWPGKNANEDMPEDARREFQTRIADLGLSIPSVFADFNGKPDQAKRLLRILEGHRHRSHRGGAARRVLMTCSKSSATNTRCSWRSITISEASPTTGVRKSCSKFARTGANASAPAPTSGNGRVPTWTRSNACGNWKDRIISFHLKDVLKKGDLHSPQHGHWRRAGRLRQHTQGTQAPGLPGCGRH